MKYGIKLRTANSINWFGTLTEYTGSSAKPLVFESIDEAEIYAQNHELPNYTIEPINEETKGPQLLNG